MVSLLVLLGMSALRSLGLMVSLLVLLGAGLCCAPSGPPEVILMVVVDTLRADRLGCYGYAGAETPNIDALAERGTLYENAISPVAVTLPSLSTLLTGAYPPQHGIRDNGPFQLSNDWLTLAEKLQAQGFATGAFVSAAVLSKNHNLTQGFDAYDDDVSMEYVPAHPRLQAMSGSLQGIERRAEVTIERALQWLGEQNGKPAFLLVHVFDPHVPVDPPAPFSERPEADLYNGEIAYVDHCLGQLFEGVESLYSPGRSLTLFVADHGEGLGTHEEFLHGDLLYEETTRVPLIVAGPGVPGGKRVEPVVRTADVTPTLCGLVGTAAPPWSIGVPLPGVPQRVAVGGDIGQRLRNTAYLEAFRPRLTHHWSELRGLRTDRWKLVQGPSYSLYDLQADPGEQVDLASRYPAVRDSLSRLLDTVAFLAVRRGRSYGDNLELSTEEREKLQSLGYITPSSATSAESDSLAVFGFAQAERGRILGLADPKERVEAARIRITAQSHITVGRAELEAGQYESAASNFREAFTTDSTQVDAYLGYAYAAQRAGQSEAGIRALQEGRKVLPQSAELAHLLALFFHRQGQESDAYAVIQSAIQAGAPDSSLRALERQLRR